MPGGGVGVVGSDSFIPGARAPEPPYNVRLFSLLEAGRRCGDCL
jgi:hypothetical protein